MATRPAVVVLAAGKGSRFEGPDHKLAQTLGTTTVLGATVRNAIASHLQVVVVTTEALASAARRHVAARDVIVVDEHPAHAPSLVGMGHSIGIGVAARPQASGWLILPGDMPLVQPGTMLAVAARLALHAVAYAQHRGLRGHPVGFSAELYSELVALAGDEGARRLVARYPALGVEVEDAGVLADVDTQADLEQVRLAHSARAAGAAPAA